MNLILKHLAIGTSALAVCLTGLPVSAEEYARGHEPGLILLREDPPRSPYRPHPQPGKALFVDPGGDTQRTVGRGTTQGLGQALEMTDEQIGSVVTGNLPTGGSASQNGNAGILGAGRAARGSISGYALTGTQAGKRSGGLASPVRQATSGIVGNMRNITSGLKQVLGAAK